MRSQAFLLVALLAGLTRPARSEEPPPEAPRREADGRWDAPWDPGTIFLPPLGSLDLLFGRRAGERGEDWYGLLTLRFPLDRFVRTESEALAPAAPTPPLSASSEPPQPSAAPLGPVGPSEELSSKSAAAEADVPRADGPTTRVTDERASASIEAPEVPIAPAEAEAARPPRTWSRVALVGLARELGDTLRTEAPEQTSIGEVASAASRARTSGWLPELRLRGAHGFDQTVAPPTSGVYGAPLTTRDGWDSAFEARLTFRLSRLVYDDGESSLLAMRQKLRAQIEARVEEGLALLAAWIAAERKLRELELDPEEALEQELLADRSALRLEVLSNGRFGPLVERHLGDRSLTSAGRRAAVRGGP